MSSPVIRALKQDDLKTVRYQLGLSLMGPLAVANQRAYAHPATITVWIALSSMMIQIMGWWPTTDGPIGIWGVLTPLPAFAAVAVPLMFYFDWNNRPPFEEAVQKALKAVDMQQPLTYYSRSPASGFYILENNGKPIGLIALDASTSSPSVDNILKEKTKATTVDTAVIRHFFVEEVYRVSGIQNDLLEFAISRAFDANSSPLPRRVRIVNSDLDSYKAATLRAAKFHSISDWSSNEPLEWNVGVFRWKNRWVEVTREEWKSQRK
ncbi:hypothetical protein K439DRAFT_1383386 [Ramaria rubella]|nr:hypothetical protein K439DRAFT_1383386 [Ramaria rubella]